MNEIDVGRIEKAVRELIEALGEDPDREGLVDTPQRVAAFYAEVFDGLHREPGDVVDAFFGEEHYQEIVMERLTAQVADALAERLDPLGVMVVIEAEHLCMSMRGVRKPGAVTVTSAVRGIMESQPATRAEAMSLLFGTSR
jgi:GTP cyclohydrolase I